MRLLFLAALGVAVSSASWAQTMDLPPDMVRWAPVAGSDGGPQIFADLQSIERHGEVVIARTWWAMSGAGDIEGGPGRYDRAVFEQRYDCPGRRTQPVTATYYYQGQLTEAVRHPVSRPSHSWTPGTYSEVVAEKVCETAEGS